MLGRAALGRAGFVAVEVLTAGAFTGFDLVSSRARLGSGWAALETFDRGVPSRSAFNQRALLPADSARCAAFTAAGS